MKTKVAGASEVTKVSLAMRALYPSVRFVPKKSSIRAITNMRSMPYHTTSAYNIPATDAVLHAAASSAALTPSTVLPYTLTNASLYNVLHVLKHLFTEKNT